MKLLALCAIATGFVTSCQKEELTNEIQTETVELSKAHQIALWDAGVNPNGAKYHSLQHPGEIEKTNGILSGDIFMALDQLAEQALAGDTNGTKQYRTRNTVSQGRTISVVGFTGSGFALTNVMRNGLQRAVNTFNAQNISLRFNLRFAATTNADMVIYNAGGSGQGGKAEFPSGGRPGKFIQIFGGMNSLSSNVNTHVIIHEMGHAIGLRHTDYARRRCSDGGNEGSGAPGAIRIPGTPSENRWGAPGLDRDSVMISCFGNEDGRISNFDRIALEYLY